MKPSWQSIPERSNLFWISLIIRIISTTGRSLAHPLLYPIAAYYVFFSTTRKASLDFLSIALGRKADLRDFFWQLFSFSECLLDRVLIYTGQDHLFNLEIEGLDLLEQHARSGKGCLMVGSHLGSFEVIRVLGEIRRGLKIKALIYGESTPMITSLFKNLAPERFEDQVIMGEPKSLLGLESHVEKGGFVALLADRSLSTAKRIPCVFMGKPALFPEAPVRIARILNLPMVFFVCINEGRGQYRLVFEELAASYEADTPSKQGSTAELLQDYASKLEYHSRRSPYNWFNFHDFWDVNA